MNRFQQLCLFVLAVLLWSGLAPGVEIKGTIDEVQKDAVRIKTASFSFSESCPYLSLFQRVFARLQLIPSGGSSPACSLRHRLTQLRNVPSFTPMSRATSAIARPESLTCLMASPVNSGVNLRRRCRTPIRDSSPWAVKPTLSVSTQRG